MAKTKAKAATTRARAQNPKAKRSAPNAPPPPSARAQNPKAKRSAPNAPPPPSDGTNAPFAKVKRAGGIDRVLNVAPDIFDDRDHIYVPRPVALPESYCTELAKGDILDQGSEGACTGFGLAAVINAQLRVRGSRIRVSSRYLYENAKRYDEYAGTDYDGSSVRGAVKGFFNCGACREEVLPYRDTKGPVVISEEAVQDAEVRPLGAYYRIPTSNISALQTAIFEAGAVYVSADTHGGWDELVDDGKMREIPFLGQPRDGSHAFALIGYDERGFILQNSWGPTWGKKGLARLTYADWLKNRVDAWVLQVGVGRLSELHGLERKKLSRSGAQVTRVRADEIAEHYLSIANGVLSTRGRYPSSPEQIEHILAQIRAYSRQAKGAPVKVAILSHGGLTDESSAAAKTRELRPFLLGNGIYPVHLIWHTGLCDELVDIAKSRLPLLSNLVSRSLADAIDARLEVATRKPGTLLWNAMKEDAKLAVYGPNGHGVGPAASFLTRLATSSIPLELHLLGHSAGSILNSYLLAHAAAEGIALKSFSLLAPAITTDLFREWAMPHIGPKKTVARLFLRTMSDADERTDQVGHVYRKSLLYLVSRAFEARPNQPLLGLARNVAHAFDGTTNEVDRAVAQFLSASGVDDHSWHRPVNSDGTLHGSFDDDPASINDWMRHVLSAEPRLPYHGKS